MTLKMERKLHLTTNEISELGGLVLTVRSELNKPKSLMKAIIEDIKRYYIHHE